MKKDRIYRAIPAMTLAALAGTQTVDALAASHPAAKSVTFKGPVVEMRWGTVQVGLVVKSKKISTVKPEVYVHTDRSVFINEQALPMLKSEVLHAQNANIDVISGATDTSQAYIESLQGAVKKARKAKALK